MILIVVPPKRLDLLLRVLERREPMHVQTFLPEPSVERFDGGVVRGLAAPTEVQDDAVGVGPAVHRRADELGPVVAVDPLGQPALESETLQRRRDILSAKALSDINRQAFAGKQVYDGERPEAAGWSRWQSGV